MSMRLPPDQVKSILDHRDGPKPIPCRCQEEATWSGAFAGVMSVVILSLFLSMLAGWCWRVFSFFAF